MLWGGHAGELEVRRSGDGSHRLSGRFPYGRAAVLSDGGRTGRPRKEQIAPRAFSYRVDKADEDIHLLVGHSYDAPLASKLTGTLTLRDTAEALTFSATVTREIAETSYGRDVLAMIASGLVAGLSPGFRIPPMRAVPDAEEIEEEDDDPENGEHRAIIRTVKQALLYELSLVTVPAYKDATAQIEARNWTDEHESVDGLQRTLNRWRP
jgi:Escherichia/Staphylococcus phage prohead protease